MTETKRPLVIVALLLGTLIVQVEITVVGTAMPHISADLKDVSLYPWVFAGYLVAYTATIPLFGMLTDSLGRRPAYGSALGLLVLGSVLCGMADSMTMLIAGRLVQGAGAGGLYVSAQTIMGDLFHVEKRGRVQSATAFVGAIGTAIGPIVGAWFVTHASWEWAFLITIPIALIAGTLVMVGLVDTTKRGTNPINWQGAALMTAILACVLVGIGKGDLNPVLLGGAVALAIPFVVVERRAKRPVLPPDLFANSAFRASALTMLFVGATQVTYVVFLPLYLQGVVGLTPETSGYLQAVPLTVVAIPAMFYVGTLIKRVGYRPVVRAGAAAGLCATLTTAGAAWGDSIELLVVGQALLGICIGLATIAAVICVQNQVAQERRGTATASVHLVRLIGSGLAPAVLGVLLLSALADRNLGLAPEDLLHRERIALLDPAALAAARADLGAAMRSLLPVMIAFGTLAFIASLFFPKVHHKH